MDMDSPDGQYKENINLIKLIKAKLHIKTLTKKILFKLK